MTVNRIKQVALTHFAINGYDGTSLAQIAETVGIKKQSIATYFRKKEDLFLAVFEEMVRDYISFIKKLHDELHSETVEKKLQYILYQSYQYKVKNPEQTAFYKRAIHFPPPFLETKIRDEITKMEEQSSVLYRDVFEEGIRTNVIKNQELENLLAAYYCLIDGITMQMFFYDTEEFNKRLSSIWKIFWDGIKQKEDFRKG
ncbi:TetR/AcrR family transcriptional regulator [Ammoniphilus sp. 3BR4]|uniref:TetR/AcrR family transcriptional regulator n=1 Tax=Ammoniphilus sp. 3BR4 TaxID=3158265 RepID=UPI003467B14E